MKSRLLFRDLNMALIESIKQYIVFYLKPEDLKPFEKFRGPISLEFVTEENLRDVSKLFSKGKVAVFQEKLKLGDIGVFARYKSDVVGYLWRRDYHSRKCVKVNEYIPLKGKFSHIHFHWLCQVFPFCFTYF